ncbi:hypothetical protein [Vibrio genomosp. F10]|uniref:hypothetical protein n=1 Tax=Vibrio genomosp. F10 TaxID=723171 RepID=UPI0003143FA6|nr:hypothetical protein [Vibrio genomosp. F10]OEE84996.1 hypothetical protein A1QK_20085 [Vibrio genomosp. F10 str. 9ZD137]
MDINIIALLIGCVVAIAIVYKFKHAGLEGKPWTYPALLASFPAYYWLFSVHAADYDALVFEFIVGLAFMVVAYLGYRVQRRLSLLILSIGFMGHGVYDVFHTFVSYHPVAPTWWAEFCGSVDILVSLYLLWLAKAVNVRRK